MGRNLEEYMNALTPRLQRVARTLEAAGYVFTNPERVLPGPPEDVDGTIGRIERLVGPLPVALALFYRRVGSVDLRGRHPTWRGCDYPDPLVLDPIAAVLDEAEEYAELENPKQDYWASDSGVFRAPIAPDPLHKADVSGGMWRGVEVPNSSEDPLVLEESHGLRFTEYLDLALKWGGFPGLADAPSHSWPLEKLRAAARAVQQGDATDEPAQ